jgi:hypothetical protein
MLTFYEFTSSLCSHCGHCNVNWHLGQKKSFCYDLYRKDTAKFMAHSYQKLKKLTIWPALITQETELFLNIFCKSEVCGIANRDGCRKFQNCVAIYMDQTLCIGDLDDLTMPTSFLKKHVKSVPKAIIIFGGSDKWVATVNKMDKIK